ncbi:zinc finger protein 721-like [Ptychodera flava]|uniref:zinc finger protein 721-like n=1 Tax=Ptychodera flava TaxID=63121 RepID=UPI00396A1AA1
MHQKDRQKPTPCEMCGDEFLNLRDLHLHKLDSHEGDGLSASEKDQLERCRCPTCGVIFSNFANLKRHERSCVQRREREKTSTTGRGDVTSDNSEGTFNLSGSVISNIPEDTAYVDGAIMSRADRSLISNDDSEVMASSSATPIRVKDVDGQAHSKTASNLRNLVDLLQRKDKKWRCYRCHQCFQSHSLLRRHLKSHRKKNDHKCDDCRRIFQIKRVLHNHIRVKHRETWKAKHQAVLTCEICKKVFARQCNVQRHKLAMHEKDSRKPDPCELCGKKFHSLRDLHLRKLESHQGNGLSSFQKDRLERCRCSECGVISSSFTNLKRHQKSCMQRKEKGKTATSGRGNLTSDNSEDTLILSGSFIAEDTANVDGATMSTSESEFATRADRTLIINDDSQVMATSSASSVVGKDLDGQAHSRTARNVRKLPKNMQRKDRKWRCYRCHQCFQSHSLLRRHLKSHRKKNDHKCDDCGRIFQIKRVLHNHIRVKHRETWKAKHQAILTCEICKKVFARQWYVQRHKLAMHEKDSRKPDPCELCGKKFRSLRGLHLHKLESHQGNGLSSFEKDRLERCRCSECGVISSSFTNLKRHQKSCIRQKEGKAPTSKCGPSTSHHDTQGTCNSSVTAPLNDSHCKASADGQGIAILTSQANTTPVLQTNCRVLC